jgi:hypothetical protein
VRAGQGAGHHPAPSSEPLAVVCSRHPRFQALSGDAQSVYLSLIVVGRYVLKTVVEEAPTMPTPHLGSGLNELYAADLLRVEDGVVLAVDLRTDGT